MACQSCLKLPSHYFPISTNQLAILLTECWRTNQISNECCICIIGNFRCSREHRCLHYRIQRITSMQTCGHLSSHGEEMRITYQWRETPWSYPRARLWLSMSWRLYSNSWLLKVSTINFTFSFPTNLEVSFHLGSRTNAISIKIPDCADLWPCSLPIWHKNLHSENW